MCPPFEFNLQAHYGEGLKPVHAAAAVGRVAVVETLLKVTPPDAVGRGGEGVVVYTSF